MANDPKADEATAAVAAAHMEAESRNTAAGSRLDGTEASPAVPASDVVWSADMVY